MRIAGTRIAGTGYSTPKKQSWPFGDWVACPRITPDDFMFRLGKEEAESLTSQIAMSKPGRGGRRTLPYVFTEQGVAMLSTVLNSERAIAVNIAIMRAFVRLRQILATHKELAERLSAMEKKNDWQFKVVFDILKQLMEPPRDAPKRRIGFVK